MREKYRNHRSQGGGQPPPHTIYMVDTPKETNGDEVTEDNPSGRKTKHGLLGNVAENKFFSMLHQDQSMESSSNEREECIYIRL